MTDERAIEILDPEHRENYESIEPVNEACRIGIEAIKARKERERGCEYCCGTIAEYQRTTNTTLSINTSGEAHALITECNPCPPAAQCSLKNNPARSAFAIKFCPNCGRQLGTV